VASRLLLPFQKLINRFANQPRNRDILPNRKFFQLFNLLRLEPHCGELLSHVKQCITLWYDCQDLWTSRRIVRNRLNGVAHFQPNAVYLQELKKCGPKRPRVT
jgi:hypothetical protein